MDDFLSQGSWRSRLDKVRVNVRLLGINDVGFLDDLRFEEVEALLPRLHAAGVLRRLNVSPALSRDVPTDV